MNGNTITKEQAEYWMRIITGPPSLTEAFQRVIDLNEQLEQANQQLARELSTTHQETPA